MRAENRQAMRRGGTVVWLKALPETIHRRMSGDATTAGRRPDLTDQGGLAEIVELLARREPIYQETADFAVDTEGKTPEQIADEILDRLPPDPRRRGPRREPHPDDSDRVSLGRAVRPRDRAWAASPTWARTGSPGTPDRSAPGRAPIPIEDARHDAGPIGCRSSAGSDCGARRRCTAPASGSGRCWSSCSLGFGLAWLYWWEIDRLGLLPASTPRPVPVAWMTMLHVQFAVHVLLIWLMLVASLIDADEKTIPDAITVSRHARRTGGWRRSIRCRCCPIWPSASA